MTARPVFLDANVLVPVSLTDLLLRLAEAGLLEPFWSPRVLADAMRAVQSRRPDLDPGAVRRRFASMARAFPDAMVGEDGLDLADSSSPDLDDRLVIGAAHRSPASTIITRNLAHFLEASLARHGLSALSPDSLLLDLLASSRGRVQGVLIGLRSDLRNPPLAMGEILGNLAEAGVPDFAGRVRPLFLE